MPIQNFKFRDGNEALGAEHVNKILQIVYAGLFVMLGQPALAQDAAIELSEVEILSSPFDEIWVDPMRPKYENRKIDQTGSAGVQRTLLHDLPVTLRDSGRPGQSSTFQGGGRSAEETQIETMGVSLNSAGGGGFSLSTFPQYLWSGYSYQLGPSATGLDSRATAGSIHLIPKTVALLAQPREEGKWSTGLGGDYSSQSFGQIWGEGALDDRFAIVMGGGWGDPLRNGAMGISGRWDRVPGMEIGFHALLGGGQAKVPGSRSFATPNATQSTLRFFRTLTAELRFNERTLYRCSLFYDMERTRFDDSDNPTTNDRTQGVQAGFDQWISYKKWRLSWLFRQAGYNQGSASESPELSSLVQASRIFDFREHNLIEPAVRVQVVQSVGIYPGASLSFLQDRSEGRIQWFERLSLNPRFPSLMNRRYQSSFFSGNRDLKPEQVVSLQAGMSGRVHSRVKLKAEILGQYRWNAMVTTGVRTPFNSGWGVSVQAMPGMEWAIVQDGSLPLLTWIQNFGVLGTYLSDSGGAFPLTAPFLSTSRVQLDWKGVFALLAFRASTSTLPSASGILPGFGLMDLGFGFRWNENFEVSARVEDLFNRAPDWFPDYSSAGRVFSLALQGSF
jgi:hypothetical protein